MVNREIADRQRELNRWTARYLRGVAPLVVDGKTGRLTNSRILATKYYLGYGERSSQWNAPFVRKLRHPHDPRYSPPWQLALGAKRRRAQRRHYAATLHPTSGVTTFDGRPVAAWLKPYLVWARDHGWQGTLNSGWRDPAYSEHLCRAMCGAPRCPGRCAGRSSNHSGSVTPAGAIDVSDYDRFGRLMRECPYEPRIFNSLGAQDPVHYSATGS